MRGQNVGQDRGHVGCLAPVPPLQVISKHFPIHCVYHNGSWAADPTSEVAWPIALGVYAPLCLHRSRMGKSVSVMKTTWGDRCTPHQCLVMPVGSCPLGPHSLQGQISVLLVPPLL